MKTLKSAVLGAGLVLATAAAASPGGSDDGWSAYGHDAGGTRYSPLTAVNRGNVAKLDVAWTFHTGDIADGKHGTHRSGFETTPILVDGSLILTTPFNRVIALDPVTGKQRWAHDPAIDKAGDYGDGLINRGVAAWLDETRRAGQDCHRRIFEATLDARLIALDAATGKPCADFGRGGEVSLRGVARYRAGWYHMTSPPAVANGVVVVGSAIDDNARVDMPDGAVRGFDARTGKLRWTWQPLPPNRAKQAKTWRSGAGNAWAPMVADEARGLVFVPTGSPSPDYFGGLRLGDDRWSNSIVALNAKTGRLVWGFQLVHHDLWDYDSASPPLLATLHKDGKPRDVVVVGNKTGMLYVLDRATGKAVFPVEEKPVPRSDVRGETASPTQPFSTGLPMLAPHDANDAKPWGINPADRAACAKAMDGLRADGIFTPPSERGTLMLPGNVGGMNWSGYSFDPVRERLFVNVDNLAAVVRLIPSAKFADVAKHAEDGAEYAVQAGAPFGMSRRFLLSPGAHLPCIPPPWGTLAAIDLRDGKMSWRVPLGSFDAAHKEVPQGAVSLGGSIATAGGLVFIAGTYEAAPQLRAFDSDSGKLLWSAPLPTSGHATPMTYRATDGRQYVVIAAGGSAKIDEEAQNDAVIAYALPAMAAP